MLICTGKLVTLLSSSVKSVLPSTVAAREMDRTGDQKSTTGKHILNTIPDPINQSTGCRSTGLDHWFRDPLVWRRAGVRLGRKFWLAWGVNLVLLEA